LRRKYGLTKSEYAAMVESQGGLCWICQKQPPTLCVDHCHKTKRIRSLLCHSCNLAVGNIKEDMSAAERLLLYIKEVCHQ
jgi:protein-arginine kinase activator protein McsA